MSLWDKRNAFDGFEKHVRCYESHPYLKLGKGRLFGGNAQFPVIKDADVYVSLQSGSTSGFVSDPWAKQTQVEVQYAISDQRAPKDVLRFKKMIDWLCTQLQEGKTVHVGCIGGHGRTGLVLSAIVAQLRPWKGDKNAIQWVRKHYCKKAVESAEQITFLVKHYGVTKVEARDYEQPQESRRVAGFEQMEYPAYSPSKSSTVNLDEARANVSRKIISPNVTPDTRMFVPMPSARSLWKHKKG